jgi:hypothetical protein
MMRQMRIAALAVAVTVVLSGLALAQRDADDDDYYYQRGYAGQAQEYGYQSGYRDGYRKGQHEGREGDYNDYQTPDWRQASRGYQSWMGPLGVFQSAFRDGYVTGFRAGFQSVNRRGDGDGDRDDRGYYPFWGEYSGSYPNRGSWGSPAYNFGYQDGASVARSDIYSHKPFNPNPRGRYDDRDHGYSREYGSKDAYRAQYAAGYRAGYQSVLQRY